MQVVEVALAVARSIGLAVDRGDVVAVGTHVLVRLEPGPIAARVTGDGPLTQFAGDLDAEARVAAALYAAGAPVVAPLSARAHPSDGRCVTFWEWNEGCGEDTADAIGRALADCHRALGAMPVALKPWTKLAQARSRLLELDARLRRLLGRHLEPPDVALRPIHGDAHAGNVLAGPAWHDWEDAQLGCVEWDLACLVAPGRVVGNDFGYGEEILAGYDAPYDAALLDRCVAARTAQQVVYGLILGDSIPGLAERIAVRIEWLSRDR